jgi:hypothetical protein
LVTALSAIFAKLFGLKAWQIPLVFIGLMLVISLPSVIMAWLKLRKRNLGPILDANGWAVNAQAKLSIPFGASLTQVATLPPGSQRDLNDPFAEKQKPWWLLVVLVVIIGAGIAWYYGKLDGNLPDGIKSTSVLGTNAPAYVAPTNSIPAVTGTNAPAAK